MPNKSTFGDETIAEWTEAIPRLLAESHVPGLSAAVVRDGGVAWSGAFGLKHAETRLPVDEDTVFLAASLSKPVFACAVLLAVERREVALDLDTPLRKYLDAPYVPDDPTVDLITARMVLSHTTGFRNWRGSEPLRVLRRPGEAFGYSGEGYVYLQRVVERLTGQLADAFVRRLVFEPLGMRSSSYLWRSEYDATAAPGHDGKSRVVKWWRPEEASVAGSLRTTALEYARVLSEVLSPERRGALLGQAIVDRMLAPQVRLGPRLEWGLGWGLQDTANGRAFWHWGDGNGYKTYVVGFPKRREGAVFLTNGDGGREVYQELLRIALGERLPSADMLDSLGDYLL